MVEESGTYLDECGLDRRDQQGRPCIVTAQGREPRSADLPSAEGLRWRVAGEIEPNGRKHQIRLQLAAEVRDLGRWKYGSRKPFGAGIALHARRLVVEHPINMIRSCWRLRFRRPGRDSACQDDF